MAQVAGASVDRRKTMPVPEKGRRGRGALRGLRSVSRIGYVINMVVPGAEMIRGDGAIAGARGENKAGMLLYEDRASGITLGEEGRRRGATWRE